MTTRYIAISFLVIVAWFSGGEIVLATERPDQVPAEAGIDEHLDSPVDLSLEFKDQTGKSRKLGDFFLENRPVIFTPVYYGCPRLCTLTLNGTVELLNNLDLELGKDFKVISVSFDSTETPELAAEKAKVYYSELKHPERGPGGWEFLTGSAESTARLMNQVGFRYKKDGDEFIHSAAIILFTPQGKISRYLYGIKYQPSDSRLSLVEAARGKIGTTFDKILLFCFRFDSTHGKYSLVVMNVVRAVSLIVLAFLVFFLISMRLKEKRQILNG